MKHLLCLILYFLLELSPITTFAQSADIILTNGKIFTSDTAELYVQALAIRGNKILAVGSNAAIEKLVTSKTKKINLQGKTVVPGFNDAHCHHMPVYSGRYIQFSRDGMASPVRKVLEDSIAHVVKELPVGTWVHAVLGPETINDPTLTRFALDSIAPNHPMRLWAFWGHVSIFNTAALKHLQVLETQPLIKAGYFEHVAGTNTINGRVYDNAQYVLPLFNQLAEDHNFVSSLQQLGKEALSYGVTTVQNMCTFASPDKYAAMWRKAGLPIRFRAIRWADMDRNGEMLIPSRKSPLHPAGLPLMSISGTKWMVEGTPIEQNAFYKTSYLKPDGWHGLVYHSQKDISRMLQDGISRKDQVMFHLVGDSIIRMVTVALNQLPRGQVKKMRVRIEHGIAIAPDQIKTLKEAGAIVVVNPVLALHDTTIYFLKDHADKDFTQVKSLINAGLPVAIGSDGPLNPFFNIMLAMIRPKESLTCEEAVIAYTKAGAFAELREKEKGMLRPGMLADLAVLSQDIFTIQPNELPKTFSELTIVDGKIVYQESETIIGPK